MSPPSGQITMPQVDDDDARLAAVRQELAGRRILVVMGSLELGGAQRQAIRLADLLQREAKATVEVWGLWKDLGGAADLCDRLALKWQIVPVRNRPWAGRRVLRRFNTIGWLMQTRRFTKAMKKWRPHYVIPFYTMANLVCGLTWRSTGARACLWNQRDTGLPRIPEWERRAARNATDWVSNSIAGADFVAEQYGIDRSRIHAVNNGVELDDPVDDRATWRHRLNIKPDMFVASMLANIVKRKDHLTLVRAWRHVVDQLTVIGRSAVLILAGYPGNKMEEVEAEITRLQLTEQVRLPGTVTDVAGLLGASDLGVHSSHIEGVPNAVLEPMAAGLAAVATDLPGVREAMGQTGEPWWYKQGDFEALAERIVTLAKDDELRAKLGAGNRRRIKERYNPLRMMLKFAELIEPNCRFGSDIR